MKVKLSLAVLVGWTVLALSSLTASANELREVELEVRGMT